METGYTCLESPPRGSGPGLQSSDDRRLESWIVPLGVAVAVADEQGGFPRGGPGLLHRPHVERIADDIATGGLNRHIDESLWVARQQRSESCIGPNSRRAELTNSA